MTYPYRTLHTDILVLGAGLAGMRAAWAAQAGGPGLNVTVVSQRFGPSGSSFANINDKLGMQVCLTDLECEGFVREAMAIAKPGYIDPDLVYILAEESEPRFRDLKTIGFPFDRDERGGYVRTTGCFSPGEKRAVVFTGLGAAFEKLKDKFLSLGGNFLEGWLIQDLIKGEDQNPQAICGAVLQKAVGDEKIAVDAGGVIVALGGPASLFLRNVAGAGTHGIAHALLNRAGATLVNTSYLQFLWHTTASHHFWPIHACLKEGALIQDPSGTVRAVPKELFGLAGLRSTHCPVAYGFTDEAVDRFFLENIGPGGEIPVFEPNRGWTTIAPMAHAGNGGAKIDKNAATGIPGLYVCGESAGGMHGANRIGGAMVTATQVFGARAGSAAVGYAGSRAPTGRKAFSRMAAHLIQTQPEDGVERQEAIRWLRQGMQTFAVAGGRPGLGAFMEKVRHRLASTRDWRTRLALESALIVGCALQR